jgi:hypothetical protein
MNYSNAKFDQPKISDEDLGPSQDMTIAPPDKPGQKTPSWFSQDIVTEAGDDLADRYKAARAEHPVIVETPGSEAYEIYRRRLDERFQQAQRLYDVPQRANSDIRAPAQRRPTLPITDIHGRRRLYEQEQRAQQAEPNMRQRGPGVPWAKVAGFGALAVMVGSLAGFSVTNTDRVTSAIQGAASSVNLVFANIAKDPPVVTPANTTTTIQKKPVAIASLDVNDVRGTLNSMIPLMLNAQPADGGDPVALKVTGLPDAAYLTAGIETSKGSWLLKPSDIAGVKLVVPQSNTSEFGLEVAVIEEKTGSLAAPVKAMSVMIDNAGTQSAAVAPVPVLAQAGEGKVDVAAADPAAQITPANAPPDTVVIKPGVPSAIPSVMNQAIDFVAKGDRLMNSGDIASARQFYLKASEMGSAEGSYGVGRSYDPQVFAALNVKGLQPDAAKAAEWYKKAAAGGVAAAQNALSGVQAAAAP